MNLEVDDEEFLKVLEELDDQTDGAVIGEYFPASEHIYCLQNSFGHSEFRPSQWKVIRSILEDKRDNCAIMTTGYGKSLCFQFPPVYTNGISLIVSPLISLMQDQVDSLNIVKISACMLGSAQSNKFIESDIIRGDYRVVYVSPEYITGRGSELIEELKDKLTLIAVDEAHCISTWGADFRPKYLELANLRAKAPNVPILAVTATASDRVQSDICNFLKLRDPQIICTGFDRHNLEIVVRRKTKDTWKDLELILKSKLLANSSCIIYCLTRKVTDDIYDLLKRCGLKCGAYHAGKSQKHRKEIYDKFIRDELNVIVATVAFGMGIDKSDVRCVIHYGAPKDIDSYYQEIGRAGRDGLQSKCILFYSDADFEVHRHLRLNSKMSGKALRAAENRANCMNDFIYTMQCRRLKILQYFDGPSVQCPKLDVCCDNCRIANTSGNVQNKNEMVDFTKDAKIMLDVIKLFNGKSGLNKPIAVIRGSKLKTIERYHDHKLMGSGKFKSEQYWKILADILEREEFLERKTGKGNDGFSITTLQINSRGEQWLKNDTTLKLMPPDQMIQLMKSGSASAPVAISSSAQPLYDNSLKPTLYSRDELKRSLMVVRAMIASREGTMPYKIASEPAIQSLAQIQPLNLQELRDAKIDGLSEALIKQFGPEFVKCIQKSKGFIPNEITDTIDGKGNHGIMETSTNLKISTPCITTNHDNQSTQTNPNANVVISKYRNMFDDDDDDLFMMVNYENATESSMVRQTVENDNILMKNTEIAKKVPKRVMYENSSEDDDSSTENTNRPQRPAINPPKPIGIRKRKIF